MTVLWYNKAYYTKDGEYMFNLVIILLSTLNGEPKGSNNYKIAKFMIENIRDLEDYTLTELAKACYVSNSSISRFCRDIGLRDFNQLKNQIAKFSIEKLNFLRSLIMKDVMKILFLLLM